MISVVISIVCIASQLVNEKSPIYFSYEVTVSSNFAPFKYFISQFFQLFNMYCLVMFVILSWCSKPQNSSIRLNPTGLLGRCLHKSDFAIIFKDIVL